MKIKYLTLTGADDNTDPLELAKLSKQYPFIEWAILISEQREGTSRYPTREWRKEFHKVCTISNNSAHLCGKEVLKRLASEEVELASELMDYQRIQLNFNAKHTDELLLMNLIQCTTSGFYAHKSGAKTQFITQYNENNEVITDKYIEAHISYPQNHSILFDASGGLGRSPESWPTVIPNKLCGYAGGLGPENILQSLDDIQSQVANSPVEAQSIWVDMEAKIRSNEKFDLNKAAEVAKKIQWWLSR